MLLLLLVALCSLDCSSPGCTFVSPNSVSALDRQQGGWAASDNAFHSWNVTSVTQCRHDVVQQLDAWAGTQAGSPHHARHIAPDASASLHGVSVAPHQNHTRVSANAAPEFGKFPSASSSLLPSSDPSTSISGVPSGSGSQVTQVPPTGLSTNGSQLPTSDPSTNPSTFGSYAPSAAPSANSTPVPRPRPFRAATTPWYGPTWDEYVFLVPGQRCISLSGTFSETAAPWHAQSPPPRLSTATAAQRLTKSHDHSTAAQRKALHGHVASNAERRDSGPPSVKAVSAEAALNLHAKTTGEVRHGKLSRQDSITLASQSTPVLTHPPKVQTGANTGKSHARRPGGKKVSPAARPSAESMEPDGGGSDSASDAPGTRSRGTGKRCCTVQ